MGLNKKKTGESNYEELKQYELKNLRRHDTLTTVDTAPLKSPPPETITWISMFSITLAAFIVGLTGLVTPNYMSGQIDMRDVKPAVAAFLPLPNDFEVPDTLMMANFGLFRFCFSDKFMVIVKSAMSLTPDAEIPENEGGMKIDFSKACHEVIETENQPQMMKDRTRQGKILMFMGLSSVFVTWLFLILVLIAGRHLSKAITAISATVSVIFLVSSLLVSMTLQKMTKDYLNLEIMKSARLSIENMGIRVEVIESITGPLEKIQPVEIKTGFSGFLIMTSGILMMIIGITSLLKTRSHKPG